MIALYIYLLLCVFYVSYIAAINLIYSWEGLAPWVRLTSFMPVFAFVVLDVVFNLTVATILFIDTPKEFMFTQRLTRYRKGDSGWRNTVSTKICTQALNPFDPTKKHC